MKKYILIVLACTGISQLKAQTGTYWQQKVDYTMEIDFDHTKHQFTGKQKLVYTNNSPDTLFRVFYHLYFNAFQPGSAMDIRSANIPDPDPRVKNRIGALKENETGYHHIQVLKQNNKDLEYAVEGTILEVELAEPILPGRQTEFYMEFNSQVPIQIRRSGRNSKEGVEYSMTQWYPKMCEYDNEGWHADPYIGREFYGVWGNFDVTISIDRKFTLGGTGYLQNAGEIGHGYELSTGEKLNLSSAQKLSWHFKAPDVHDFAWAADSNYAHDIGYVPNGPVLHFLYLNDSANTQKWKKLQPMMVDFFEKMNETFGVYPYNQFSFIQGGDGGMEYPMATLVTSSGSFEGLVGVCVHEAIHNWYYGVLATNESKYPWMDEGFTQFGTDYIENYLFSAGLTNPFQGAYSYSGSLWKSSDREPLTTHSDFYHKNATYSTSAYGLGEVFLAQLIYVLGEETFYAGMRRYFNEWKFKHPKPEDFIRCMEKESGLELNWYLEQFINSMNTIDYGISIVVENGNSTSVLLKKEGNFPMPLDVKVETKDGKTYWINIPLDIMRGHKTLPENTSTLITSVAPDWNWVNPTYTLEVPTELKNIQKISINNGGFLFDLDASDNNYNR